MIFLSAVYLMPFFINYDWHYLLRYGCMGLTFPFVFNSIINVYRKLPISHLGKADFLTFPETIICFVFGIAGIILIVYKY
jgi:hypothetical protein